MEKFKNKYRIASARAPWWNYGWATAYFITICTKNRDHYFGEIKNRKMILSNMGTIANILWFEMQHHAKNIELGSFVVMPNHIHGILILNTDNGINNDNKTEIPVSNHIQIPADPPIIPTDSSMGNNGNRNDDNDGNDFDIESDFDNVETCLVSTLSKST